MAFCNSAMNGNPIATRIPVLRSRRAINSRRRIAEPQTEIQKLMIVTESQFRPIERQPRMFRKDRRYLRPRTTRRLPKWE